MTVAFAYHARLTRRSLPPLPAPTLVHFFVANRWMVAAYIYTLWQLTCAWPIAAQTYRLAGRVLDTTAKAPIVGTSVILNSNVRVFTDSSGQFHFDNVIAGPNQIVFSALGYSQKTVIISAPADTLLLITLDAMPIVLDPILITAATLTLRGEVIERTTNRPVIDAKVYAPGRPEVTTKISGAFVFKNVRSNMPFDLEVRAFGLAPLFLSVMAARDTSIRILLNPDTMVVRLAQVQIGRLESRAKATVGKSYALTREQLLQHGDLLLGEAINEALRYAPFSRQPALCVFIDEVPSDGDAANMLYPEEIYRVELLYNGRMIRIYTSRFMARMLSSQVPLRQPGLAAVPGRGGRGIAWASCG